MKKVSKFRVVDSAIAAERSIYPPRVRTGICQCISRHFSNTQNKLSRHGAAIPTPKAAQNSPKQVGNNEKTRLLERLARIFGTLRHPHMFFTPKRPLKTSKPALFMKKIMRKTRQPTCRIHKAGCVHSLRKTCLAHSAGSDLQSS